MFRAKTKFPFILPGSDQAGLICCWSGWASLSFRSNAVLVQQMNCKFDNLTEKCCIVGSPRCAILWLLIQKFSVTQDKSQSALETSRPKSTHRLILITINIAPILQAFTKPSPESSYQVRSAEFTIYYQRSPSLQTFFLKGLHDNPWQLMLLDNKNQNLYHVLNRSSGARRLL